MKKTIISLLSFLIGGLTGAGVMKKMTDETIDKTRNVADKHLELFLLMNQWVRVKQDGKNLSTYFTKKGYKRIAVYGMSYVGVTLLEELKGTEIEVAYGIDKSEDGMYVDVDVVSMGDTLDEVDAIVVTAISFFEEIQGQLTEKVNCPIISLEDVLYEI